MNILVLVVDDEPDVEMLFKQQFRRDTRDGRFALEFSLSAPAALERIAAAASDTERRIILVLSDINMPGMSGLDLLARIKTDKPDLPVVMITAYGDADTRRKALALGAHGLLTKPVDFAALRTEIDQRLAELGARA